MKGAILVSPSNRLFNIARDVLVQLGATYYAANASVRRHAVQLRDEDGNLFTLYDDAEPESEWRDIPLTSATGTQVPNMTNMFGCAIECRHENTFATLTKAIACATDAEVWVVDGCGVLWPAAAVKADQVCL
jgi:hypothetical protein